VALLALAVASQADGAEFTRGQLLFNNLCRTCHTLRAADNRLGPTLFGIVGRPVGSEPNYVYSSTMSNTGERWTVDLLDRFLQDPDVVFPGNGMRPYSGLVSPNERDDIIGYLSGLRGPP
jgi:cytochrome c